MQLHLLFPSGGRSNRQFAAFVEFDDTSVGESDFGVRPFARPHAVTIFQSRADFAGQPLSRSRPLMLHDPHDGGNRRLLRPALFLPKRPTRLSTTADACAPPPSLLFRQPSDLPAISLLWDGKTITPLFALLCDRRQQPLRGAKHRPRPEPCKLARDAPDPAPSLRRRIQRSSEHLQLERLRKSSR
jgi:hypothetical protein